MPAPTANELPAKAEWITSRDAALRGYELNDDAPEPASCAHCGRTLYYRGLIHPFFPGRVSVWQPPEPCDCDAARQAREDEKRRAEQAEAETRARDEALRMRRRVARVMRESGIRDRYAMYTFERFEVTPQNESAYKSALRYANTFSSLLPVRDERGNLTPARKRNGLFITGSCGTGKTHLATAIANRLLERGEAVICMTMIELLKRIRQTYDHGGDVSESEVLALYERVPLLVIDDIGSEHPTEWGAATVYAIVNARYVSYMPTIVTTNYTGEELARRMTPAAAGRPPDATNAEKTLDRLREMCAGIEMIWESWRLK